MRGTYWLRRWRRNRQGLGPDDARQLGGARQGQKTGRTGRGDESFFSPALLALCADIRFERLVGGEDLVQPAVVVDELGGHVAAVFEHACQKVVVVTVKCEEHCENTVPTRVVARDDAVFVDLLAQAAFQGLFGQPIAFRAAGRGRDGQRFDVDGQHVPMKCKGHQILGQFGQLARRELLARLQHDLKPEGEAVGIELLVFTRTLASPKIVVEDALELSSGSQGDDFTAVLKSDMLDELAQGWQVLEQPSPLTVLPSSHFSLAVMTPSPQRSDALTLVMLGSATTQRARALEPIESSHHGSCFRSRHASVAFQMTTGGYDADVRKQSSLRGELLMILKLSSLVTAMVAASNVYGAAQSQPGTSGSFSVLTYNVDGLPAILQDGRYPGGNPDLYTPITGQKARAYDIVNVQEDFNSHAALYANDNHPYRTATSGGAGIGSGLNTMSNFPFSDEIDRVTWNTRSSDEGNNLTPKGFTWLRLCIAPGVYLDWYNVHTNSGTGTADETARVDNINQLVSYINTNSVGNAVIVSGDTNSRYTRADDDIRVLLDAMQSDTWINLEQGGVAPAAGSPDLVWDAATHYVTALTPAQYVYEFVDKIFYRGNNYISLTPYNYNMPDAYFRDSSNNMLSDHYPVSVNIQYELNPNLKLSDQFGGPHGTSYTDVNSIPASAVVQAIGMRNGRRVDQVNLTLASGQTFIHGGSGGTASELLLARGEYVTSVTFAEAQYNGHTRIFYAGFTTNYGRTLSGGSKTSDSVTYTAPQGWQIVGFHGRSGDELDKAGVVFAPVGQ